MSDTGDTESRLLETVEYLPYEQLVERFFGHGPTPVQIDFGARTDRGKVRSGNEDHFVVMRRRRSQSLLMSNFPEDARKPDVSEDAYAFAVADGMGGEVFGAQASRIALQTGLNLGPYETNWPVKIDERDIGELLDKLDVYLKLMDRTLIHEGNKNPEAHGMGTTFTVAYVSGLTALIGHVGDSRAYLVREESIRQLTADHTVAEEMVRAGHIESDSDEYRRLKHMLTNCLGGPKEGVTVETHHLRLEADDHVLLCTDGLTDVVSDSELLAIILGSKNPEQAADALVEKALAAGGPDNVTAIVTRFRVEGNPAVDEAPPFRPCLVLCQS